ncbi:MAG: hybrid sensor histidine kinase/response regulator [Burkholderiaceae bacterium]
MTKPPISVLIVEDDMVDRLACRRAFSKDTEYQFELIEAETGQEGLELARERNPDCILLDYRLPDLTGLEFLDRLAKNTGTISIPVMMLTGGDSAAVAAEAMRRGARDYLGKDVDRQYLELLPAAIHRMLREQRLINDKRQAEAKFRTLVEQIQAIIYIIDLGKSRALDYISPQIRVLGFSPEEWLAQPNLHIQQIHPDDRALAIQMIEASRATGMPLRHEYRMLTKEGNVMWFREEAEFIKDESGQKLCMQGLLVDITRNKLVEEALRMSQEELRKLAAHQESIKEEERKRIAQEIHDELGGLLTGIKAYISVSIERTAQAGLEPDRLLVDAAGLAKDAIETVRKVITDLRPSVLDQLGIWAALEWYVEQIEMRSGLVCDCTIDASAAAIELDAERSMMVFRIVQEALTNVVRHAQASSVSIQAERTDNLLSVKIRDNGKGIDADRLLNRESWGILGMIERTRHFGGDLKITGEPGQGTLLVLQMPVEHANG